MLSVCLTECHESLTLLIFMTHDYKRNGTTTLFAALNVLDGKVIAQCQEHHRHTEWLKFLKKIDRETPKGKTLHLIADNYGGTHCRRY